ncbi:MAG: hypothetical protein ACTSU5_03115 [Promethearchaeota archaeon]
MAETELGEVIWDYAEILLVPVMFSVAGFFLWNALKSRREGVASTASFQLGYFFFFLVNGINQLSYVAFEVDGFWPAFREVLRLPDLGVVLFGTNVKLKSQILFMMACFFFAFAPCMYPVEKYLRQRERFPLFWMGVASGALTFGLWLAWYPFGLYSDSPAVAYLLGAGMLFAVVTALVDFVLFIGIYFQLARTTPGEVRKKSLYIALGILLLYLSLLVGNALKSTLKDLNPWLVLVGPVSLLLGMVVLVAGFNKKI